MSQSLVGGKSEDIKTFSMLALSANSAQGKSFDKKGEQE